MSGACRGCRRARDGREDEDRAPGVGAIFVYYSNCLPAPVPVDDPALRAIFLGRQVLGEGPTHFPKACCALVADGRITWRAEDGRCGSSRCVGPALDGW